MDEASITRYIADTFAGVDVVVASCETGAPEVAWGDTFFSYDPDRDLEPKHRLPFATIVTKDYGDFDRASNLNRPGVFRLNIGVSKSRIAWHWVTWVETKGDRGCDALPHSTWVRYFGA